VIRASERRRLVALPQGTLPDRAWLAAVRLWMSPVSTPTITRSRISAQKKRFCAHVPSRDSGPGGLPRTTVFTG
jgi:hypothetical protein